MTTNHGLRALPGFDQPLAAALVDEIECGLIVCDAQGALHYANRAALRELATAQVLERAGTALRSADGSGPELERALHAAAERGRRSMLALGRGAQRLMVSVQPLALPGDGTVGGALVMLGRRSICSELGLELLAGRYGLTLAERRVLAGLLAGASARDVAADHGVALSTVRTQIAAVRDKLGTRRIEGLLRRAAELPPVASALRLAQPANEQPVRLRAAA